MSAKHAVLGLVIEQPGYGYQLAQRLEERCGAWRWESSGVYGALDSLSKDGNVRSVKQKGSRSSARAAPRAIYEATPKGESFFREWMLRSSKPSPIRQDLDLKILFSGPESIPHLIDQTWAQERRCLDDLGALTSMTQPGPAGRMTWHEAAVVLQRDVAVKQLQVRIEWLQSARKLMTEILNRSAGDPQTG